MTIEQSVPTFYANVYMGMREGYSNKLHYLSEARPIIEKFCDERKVCVTVTETYFTYVDGSEPGFIVGFINYPRFPSTEYDILSMAEDLGLILGKAFKQERFSIVTPSSTRMYEDFQ